MSNVCRIFLAGMFLGSAACASLRDPSTGAVAGLHTASITVEVRNENWSDIRVYALEGPARHRLGTVPAMTTARLEAPEIVLGHSGEIRFLLHPVGGGEEHITRGLMVPAGKIVALSVRNAIRLTVASLR